MDVGPATRRPPLRAAFLLLAVSGILRGRIRYFFFGGRPRRFGAESVVFAFGGRPRRLGAGLSAFALGGLPRRFGAGEASALTLGGRPRRFGSLAPLADFGGRPGPRRLGASSVLLAVPLGVLL